MREAILAGLQTRMGFEADPAPLLAQADVLDAVVCLLAAADFLAGACPPPEHLDRARKEGWIWVGRPRRA